MNILKKSKNLLQLGYWLLWAKDTQKSKDIKHTTIFCQNYAANNKAIKVSVFRPKTKPPTRTCLIIPGLSPQGASDPRIIKLATTFAKVGYLVYVPFVDDYIKLHIKPNTYTDIAAVFDDLYEHSYKDFQDPQPIILSLSFGSLMAFKLASDLERREKIKHMFLFGGYAEWLPTVQAIVEGDRYGQQIKQYDRQVLPVIFIHLLSLICKDDSQLDGDLIQKKTDEFIAKSWNSQEPKDLSLLRAIAQDISKDMPIHDKKIFLQGCGLESGYQDMFMNLLKKAKFKYLEPLTNKENILCPISLIHSYNDTIISINQFESLLNLIDPKYIRHSSIITLYSHSEKTTDSILTLISKHSKDVLNMMKVFWSIS